MGNNKIKKLIKQQKQWTDKSAPKHKHDFSEPVIILLHGNENKHIGNMKYKALKCKYCLSFRNAEFTNNDYPDLRVIKFKKPHFAIGFQDIQPDTNTDMLL